MNSVFSLEISKVEYQHPINISLFTNNRSKSVIELYDWIDYNLEDKQLKDNFIIRKKTIKYTLRKVIRYKLYNNSNSLVKYRKSIINGGQNDLVWKIQGISNISNLWKPNKIYNSSYKIELNRYCNKNSRIDYSIFIYFNNDFELNQLNNSNNINYYFPEYSKYYEISNNEKIKYKITYEWIVDVDVLYNKSKCKFTLQIPYNNLNDYYNNQPLIKGELSYKAKRKDSVHWNKTISILNKIYNIMEHSKWVNKTYCNEIIKKNKNDFLILFIIIFLISIVITFTVFYFIFIKKEY